MKNNCFSDICDTQGTELEGSLFGTAFGGANEPRLPAKPTIQVMLPCTLKELYNGCIKTISYHRQTVALDGKTVSEAACNK